MADAASQWRVLQALLPWALGTALSVAVGIAASGFRGGLMRAVAQAGAVAWIDAVDRGLRRALLLVALVGPPCFCARSDGQGLVINGKLLWICPANSRDHVMEPCPLPPVSTDLTNECRPVVARGFFYSADSARSSWTGVTHTLERQPE